ncbi:hypothetical protein LEMLEM_LOCUS11905, partial [Lemmus lemmus]
MCVYVVCVQVHVCAGACVCGCMCVRVCIWRLDRWTAVRELILLFCRGVSLGITLRASD